MCEEILYLHPQSLYLHWSKDEYRKCVQAATYPLSQEIQYPTHDTKLTRVNFSLFIAISLFCKVLTIQVQGVSKSFLMRPPGVDEPPGLSTLEDSDRAGEFGAPDRDGPALLT